MLRLVILALPIALIAGCTAGPSPSATPAVVPTESAVEFTPVPERELVTLYDDPFDDNSGSWLEPGDDANQITGGEFMFEGIAGFSTRWIGNVPLGLSQPEVRATVEFAAQNLAEVGLYCRLDHGFNHYYRFVLSATGTRITKGVPEDSVAIDLFGAPGPVLDPNLAGTMALACFEEPDGFHVEAFLDGELIAQAIDTDTPPAGVNVRVAWANQTKAQSDGPYIFRMSRFLMEGRP